MMGSNISFKYLKRFRYKGNSTGLTRYLDMVNRKQGIVKDNVMASVLAQAGYAWKDDAPAQSRYDPEGLYVALRKYDRQQVFAPNRSVLEKAYNVVRSCFATLEGQLFPYDPKTVILHLKMQASAGAPYFDKKESVIEGGWEYDIGKVGEDPCVAYYRTQSRRSEAGEWSPKVRLVWGYPLDTTVAEGRYARPVLEALMTTKSPYVLGLGPMEVGAKLNSITWRPFVGSFDWSGFDSSIPAQLISLAFKMVKSWFKAGTIDEAEWTKIVKYFIFTPILMPDGKVYVGKKGGIPSGSYFTGIIGSVVNLLCIQYLMLSQGHQVYADNVLVMGDDSVVGVQHELDVPALGQEAARAFGMELHPEKQRYTKNATEVDFLSHTWCNGRQYRDIDVTLAKMIYSERGWRTKPGQTPNQLRAEKALSLIRDNPKALKPLWKVMESLGESWWIDPFGKRFYTTREKTLGNFSNFDAVTGGFLASMCYGK